MKKYIAEVVFLLVAISLIVVFAVRPPEPKPERVPEPEPVPIPEPVMLFGLPVDSFIIETEPILRNQNLSDILVKKNISYQTIDQLARKSKPIFDVRRIKHKNHYHFFLKNDSLQTPAYFVYEIDNTDYVVYQLQDSLHIYTGQKPTTTELKTASGTIKSSLWNALIENNINPVLAIELSQIYQWSIDFFGIQRGDQFRIIYEEQFVDSISVGIGEIYACQFHHMKQDYYAFLFEQDSTLSYFDDQGQSLKKAFLKAPLEFSRISSRFSNSRYHPVLKIRRPHHGIDYAAPTGTPVQSIGDGVVTRKGYQRAGGGNYLYIKHNSVYTTCYMHLHGFAKGIATGTRVKQGQVIGYVGSTGLSTGPHLDFRVFRNGSPMDPLKVEAPPVEPVYDENLAAFTALKDSMMTQLSFIPFQE
ncbi:M23 family metallopeptidase [uncultured Sunxiuqinia sp.]|uniref:M23 family metallopeptidase n=1 Tax=uncultured Sunxiuqinia sp. TaxID=1573825 RepID=UPI0030D9396F|tara:strand:+ start:13878 stop:15125 length:1248 start_codon:yes stop_codon:yes gene_type:complete